jgi:hypothetical protein
MSLMDTDLAVPLGAQCVSSFMIQREKFHIQNSEDDR